MSQKLSFSSTEKRVSAGVSGGRCGGQIAIKRSLHLHKERKESNSKYTLGEVSGGGNGGYASDMQDSVHTKARSAKTLSNSKRLDKPKSASVGRPYQGEGHREESKGWLAKEGSPQRTSQGHFKQGGAVAERCPRDSCEGDTSRVATGGRDDRIGSEECMLSECGINEGNRSPSPSKGRRESEGAGHRKSVSCYRGKTMQPLPREEAEVESLAFVEEIAGRYPLILACNSQAHMQIGSALRAMSSRGQICLVECAASRLQEAHYICSMECGIIRVKYEDLSCKKVSMQSLEVAMTKLAASFLRAYVLVDITHDATRSTNFDPIARSPEKYLQTLLRISSGVRLLTHEGAQNGANLVLGLALQESRGADSIQWLASDRQVTGASSEGQEWKEEFLEHVKGFKENGALGLLAATPNLNIMHALYILSKIASIAELAACVVQGIARGKLPLLSNYRFECLSSAFTRQLCVSAS
jgi:hypothetical protein